MPGKRGQKTKQIQKVKHSSDIQTTDRKVMHSLFPIISLFLVLSPLILLELMLRLLGFGISTRPFHNFKYFPSAYTDNTNFKAKYYPGLSKELVQNTKNIFESRKSPEIMRGFVLGGSTAEGFPAAVNHSFGKMLETALNQVPGRTFEVHNVAFTAMSSYYVKDAARKLLAYQPDFLIIYSGHNEYYGTISHSSGGTHWSRNLLLAAKEIRIIQLLMSIIARPQSSGSTLMEKQFAESAFPPDNKRDQQVVRNYLKNIQAVIRLYQRKKIPVFIIEPVANLSDMPPFRTATNELPEKDYQTITQLLKQSDTAALKSWKKQLESRLTNSKDAYLVYSYASILDRLKDTNAHLFYQSARDLDTVPFRSRSQLNNGLKDMLAAEVPFAKWIPVYEPMQSQGWHPGNELFSDHLHFNYQGNVLIARLLAEHISSWYGFSAPEKLLINRFLSNETVLREKIHSLPEFEYSTYQRLIDLFQAEPYKGMKIAFSPGSLTVTKYLTDYFSEAQLEKLNKLHDESAGDLSRFFLLLENSYITARQYDKYHALLQAYVFLNPGQYSHYLKLADFLAQTGNSFDDTLQNYIKAYLFSGKQKKIYESMKKFVIRNRPEVMPAIEKQFGKPLRP